MPLEKVLAALKSSEGGLSHSEVNRRQALYGLNILRTPRHFQTLLLFLSQFNSPILLLLITAAVLSLFLGGRTDALIICIIIGFSGLLSFWVLGICSANFPVCFSTGRLSPVRLASLTKR